MSAFGTKEKTHTFLMGRNQTSTGKFIPGFSFFVSGNFMKKYFVSGSLYLIPVALVETFLIIKTFL
jgi:hypothetical protein